MIEFEMFALGLLTISTLTSLTTEAVKRILTEHGTEYHANTLTGCVAAILSLGIGGGYIVLMEKGITSSSVICVIALIFMSWLCAMVGYDKVIQAIGQIRTHESNK